MVSSLIDEDTKWWKSDLVRSIFLPFKAESILKIPISYSLPEDQLIWMGNKRGSFTVKSAMCVVEENETGESTAEHNQSPFWRRIWHLKVRIFAWRACRNGLPTKLNLWCRGLNSSSFCPLCNKEMESLQHALLHCTHAKHTWVSWLDGPVNFSWSCGQSGETETRLFTMTQQSRQSRFGNLQKEHWLQWFSAHPSPISPTSPCPPDCTSTRIFKIKVDGATDDRGGNSCIGVIIRDSSGSSIGALSMVLPSCFPAEITEAYALQ